MTTLVLLGYWGFGFSIMSRNGIQEPSPARMSCSIFLVSFGCAAVIAADAQKNLTLKLKKGLITDGWSTYTRNPNYLAEIMIYSGFASLTGRWEAWGYLGFVWTSLFLERTILKEFSLMKKPGWEQ